MGILSVFKAQKAYKLQTKDLTSPEAQKLYEEAIASGLSDPRYLLAYTTLLVRSGQYEKAKAFLIRIQKNPMNADQKNTLFINYAACCLRLGETDKGIRLLRRQHDHSPSGKIYQTLGVLYVEKFDREHEPDFAALDAAAAEERERRREQAQAEAAQAAETQEAGNQDEQDGVEAGEDAEAQEQQAEEVIVPAAQAWEEERNKALAFEKEAVEYDDEDPVCLDNLAQFYYRCLGDRETAKGWFEKALENKEGQIDTLWFLSRYDLERGDTAKAIERLKKAAEGRPSPLNYASREMIENELKRLGA